MSDAEVSGPREEVTVAIPTVGRPEMLARALRSVLTQSGCRVQVVVSDNAADVDLGALVPDLEDPRVLLQRHPARVPMTDNWNSCLDVALGDFFLLLSDDDVIAPGALAALRTGFRGRDGRDDPQVGAVYGRTLITDEGGAALWTSLRGVADEPAAAFARALARHRRAIYLCSTMLRTGELRRVGGYDQARFGPAADLGASLQVAFACGRVRWTDTVVSAYTEHTSSTTSRLAIEEWAKAVTSIGALLQDGSHGTGTLSDREVREFVAYGVMDIARASGKASERGVLSAWLRAERARRAAHCQASATASLRLVAKVLYLRAGELLGRSAPRASADRESDT